MFAIKNRTMLQVNRLAFRYKTTPVLKDISFSVDEGEHVSIIGESGSGKTTLLKLLYGELDPTQGDVFWKEIQILGPKHNLVVGYDFIKYVAQEFDLMPFTTVEDNIGKHLSNFYPREKTQRIEELIKVVELEAFAQTKVKNLSGGQKQRVALARALAKKPEIILLDEPFSHIDSFKKQSLRRSLFTYLKNKKITCIVATHDNDDVLRYADRMMVLDHGNIIEIGTPQQLYQCPKTALIASFFGEFNRIEPYGIVYADQLKVVEDSNLKAMVKHSFFNGRNYLIEAELDSQRIYFEHPKTIEKGSSVYLKVIE
ncbi:MAG TPA: ABC transporter ATP-binding protein [Flavobacteriaceae bacterium]|nr:ABC transporter ATP-binding protein [Flavobacteriaceae bacterium]